MRNSTLNTETTHDLLILMKKTLELYASERKSTNTLVPRILKMSLTRSLTLSISLLELVIDMALTSPLHGNESIQPIWLKNEPRLRQEAKDILILMSSNQQDG